MNQSKRKRESKIFWTDKERSMLFWLAFFIIVFNVFCWTLFVPTISSNLSDYDKCTGTSEYATVKTFTEPRRSKFGTRYSQVERLALKLKEYSQEFTIGPDYSQYWSDISTHTKQPRVFTIYTRSPERYKNPMQIESGDKVLLPLSYHKKINWYLIIGFGLATVVFIYLFTRVLKSYRLKHFAKDQQKWKTGLWGKIKVIFSFIFD